VKTVEVMFRRSKDKFGFLKLILGVAIGYHLTVYVAKPLILPNKSTTNSDSTNDQKK